MTSPEATFADLLFGFSSAEKEGAEAPDLLLDGFFDDSNLSRSALSGPLFLFLGYKGSGKTALAERARLLARDDAELFVSTLTLDQFSYSDFKAVAGGTSDVSSRYPTAWAWLLLTQLIQSLEQDEAGRHGASTEYRDVINGLTDLGLMPIPKLGQLVTTSSKRSFKASIPKFLEAITERVSSTHELQMAQLVAVLTHAVSSFTTNSRHVIFVDGLDAIVTQRELQFQSLASLIEECERLNNTFRGRRLPYKFVVLCRTDIFERLPGSNINKVRQDSAAALNWYDNPREPDRSKLIRMINKRARLSFRRSVNIFSEFFPGRIDGRPVRTVILDHTRHTPRDLVQILRYIQDTVDKPGPLTPQQVKAGLRNYSMEYFIPELRNELSGYLDDGDIANAITLLTALRKQKFTTRELAHKATLMGFTSLDADSVVRALFGCSCLGTIEQQSGQIPLFTFKYRNPNATVVPDQTLWLHPATLKGLNIETAVGQRPRRGGGSRQRRGGTARRRRT